MDKQTMERHFNAAMARLKSLWGNMLTEEMLDSARNHGGALARAAHDRATKLRQAAQRQLTRLRR